MTGYTKLFSSILMSSVWEEPTESRIVWVTLLALADQHGHVDGTVKSLARVARVPLVACQRAIHTFLAPDPDDRSGVDQGRRIHPAVGGWDLVNYAAYRHRMSVEERRERDKIRKRAMRASARRPPVSENVRDVSQAEAEAEADTKTKREKSGASRPSLSSSRDPFTDPEVTERAGRFVERYEALYPQHRKGARYAVKPTRDYAAAVTLCQTWPDDTRLDKLAAIFLTTDHKFAEEGSRTIPQFLALASWCDGKLVDWEAKQA